MARNEIPFEYTPGPIPDFAPGETAEQYMGKLLPYLRDEFENIRRQFEILPIIPSVREPPQAPFNGMTRYFSDSYWTPSGGPPGVYRYDGGDWKLFDFYGGAFPHA
jgi:hypothetical protein